MVSSKKQLLVLHVEESDEDGKTIQRHLESMELDIHYERVSTRSAFLHLLECERWDIVLSDFFITGLSVIEAFEKVSHLKADMAFVVVAGRIGEECVADLMRAGVEDVVMKCRPEKLIPVVRRILREQEIRSQEIQARMIASQAYAAKEQMLAIVSHDIKNPLSAIQLDAQMLLRNAELRPEALSVEDVKLQAKRILKTTERLKILITDLLDKNKNDNGLASLSKSQADPLRLIQEVLDSCRPLLLEKEIQVQVTPIRADFSILMDRNKIFQVISNLMSNAVKFSPLGGKISIFFEETKGDYVLSVSDSGPGLSQMELQKVFEKFWTGGSGTGLGLFICKTIVEAHGGKIMAKNNPVGGAVFSFNVPKPLCKRQNQEPMQSSDRNTTKLPIVVIDDDEDLREVICWALDKEGFSVKSYGNPYQALKHLQEGRFLPELMIVDYHMSELMGGEFLKLKKNIPSLHVQNCPVIMISASPNEVQRDVRRELYCDIITKPIDLEGLVSKIKMNIKI